MAIDIEIKAKNMKVSDRMQDYINKKIGKLDRYLDVLETADVDLTYAQSARSAKDRQVAQVTVRGKQAHAAMPHTGIDAIEAATHILQAVYAYRAELATRRSAVTGIDHATLNVGLIQGGINTNVVPDLVTFRIDRRMIPEESPQTVEAQLRDAILSVASAYPGITVAVRRIMLAEALTPLPGVERLLGPLTRHASRVFGVPVEATGSPLYTDGRHYAKAGIPTLLYGAGPRGLVEANAHAADERLVLDDLRKATEVVATTLAEVLES